MEKRDLNSENLYREIVLAEVVNLITILNTKETEEERKLVLSTNKVYQLLLPNQKQALVELMHEFFKSKNAVENVFFQKKLDLILDLKEDQKKIYEQTLILFFSLLADLVYGDKKELQAKINLLIDDDAKSSSNDSFQKIMKEIQREVAQHDLTIGIVNDRLFTKIEEAFALRGIPMGILDYNMKCAESFHQILFQKELQIQESQTKKKVNLLLHPALKLFLNKKKNN